MTCTARWPNTARWSSWGRVRGDGWALRVVHCFNETDSAGSREGRGSSSRRRGDEEVCVTRFDEL